ncbi:MAG: 50S ribosomal protein L11 methyltransferase [Polyangiaceae bacterium]
MTEPRYPYVAVDVTAADADVAAARLFALGAKGIEERDKTTLVRSAAGHTTLVASFQDHAAAREAVAGLPRGWSPRLEEVVGDAWRDEWKKHFEPFRICEGVVVRPPWRKHRARRGEKVIELEPGRAFGTGLHETTALVAEVLVEQAGTFADEDVLDVGAGSGILSFVALSLGARRVVAIDVDPDAVQVTRENAERNALTDQVDASTRPVQSIRARYPVVVANIEARTLVEMAEALAPRVAGGGLLVLSGILAPHVAPDQQPAVARAFASLSLEQVKTRGEWIAMVLRAPPRRAPKRAAGRRSR